MATMLKRLNFRQHYSEYGQGLFIVNTEKSLPKDQVDLNVGQTLSEQLALLPTEERKGCIAFFMGRKHMLGLDATTHKMI